MKDFATSTYGAAIGHMEFVTNATENLAHTVLQATRKNAVTCLTSLHARGLDYKCYDREIDAAGGLLVICAYLPNEKSEEVQIMVGRLSPLLT
jgi:preprotein translocase subunit SecA